MADAKEMNGLMCPSALLRIFHWELRMHANDAACQMPSLAKLSWCTFASELASVGIFVCANLRLESRPSCRVMHDLQPVLSGGFWAPSEQPWNANISLGWGVSRAALPG
jgi:hypothetical protein